LIQTEVDQKVPHAELLSGLDHLRSEHSIFWFLPKPNQFMKSVQKVALTKIATFAKLAKLNFDRL
jgi:hypothetical protein